MNLFCLFKKKKTYKDYKTSERAAVYEKIASELGQTPQHVYEIAHGKEIKCYDDAVIHDRLIQNGILHIQESL